MDFIQEDYIDINQIIQDQQLKPYFLDVVGKVVLKNLYSSYHHRFIAKLKAQKDMYDSLYILTEKLRFVVPDEHIQPTIAEVLKHYMESLRPILKKEKFDAL
ncbi:MAG: hypothetical protein ACOYXT_23880 [Bacteroidota bacterium]